MLSQRIHFFVEPFAMERRTDCHSNPVVSWVFSSQNEAGYALSSGSLLSLQKIQNWNQRTRSATADPETDHRPPLVQTPDLVIIGTNITWEQRDETKGLWNPETLSLQFTIASIRQDLEKMELKSCNICKSLPIDYMHLCLRTSTLGFNTAATQGNKQVAGAVQKDHIQMLSSWNQLNLLVTT